MAGMVFSNPSQGIRSVLSRKDVADKGVRVRSGNNCLAIDLHIAVTYGVNISAIGKSIVNKVRDTVEAVSYTHLDVYKRQFI